ncbi:arp2/3 complex-activating protein rickA-like [Octopus sinensis]|uniref:Arp2/3 complex-activating protein rickA-like n=1 Tax=Octopus sinensis TaxID=2607531 RepID=A0A7E6EZC8_9MOLL|nr:arp2/3 complex-activating protein rickA-like [Octopus sinensis]XP_036360962.1 arp2/3 complex-activating protein rickA-like [Octopus sinensis]
MARHLSLSKAVKQPVFLPPFQRVAFGQQNYTETKYYKEMYAIHRNFVLKAKAKIDNKTPNPHRNLAFKLDVLKREGQHYLAIEKANRQLSDTLANKKAEVDCWKSDWNRWKQCTGGQRSREKKLQEIVFDNIILWKHISEQKSQYDYLCKERKKLLQKRMLPVIRPKKAVQLQLTKRATKPTPQAEPKLPSVPTDPTKQAGSIPPPSQAESIPPPPLAEPTVTETKPPPQAAATEENVPSPQTEQPQPEENQPLPQAKTAEILPPLQEDPAEAKE